MSLDIYCICGKISAPIYYTYLYTVMVMINPKKKNIYVSSTAAEINFSL